jgi:V/A-type H+-transporting ATPase subunit I
MRLRPVEMSKLRVIGLRKELAKTVTALHESGLVELKEVDSSSVRKDAPSEDFKAISEQLVKLRGIESYLKKGRPHGKTCGSCEHAGLKELLREVQAITIDTRLSELQKESEEAHDRKKNLSEIRKTLGPFRHIAIDFSARSEMVGYHLGSVAASKFSEFRKALDSATKNYTMVSRLRGDRMMCLVAVDSKAEVGGAFGEAGFIETDISGLDGTPEHILSKADEEMSHLDKAINDSKRELSEFSQNHYERIVQLREMLEIAADRAEVVAKFGRTDELFVIEGFAPEEDMGKLRGCLFEALGERYVIQETKPKEGEGPTLLEHGKAAEPLQFLVEFYSLPRTGEIDPTLILLVTFPVIYGMMLGDVGYGLASLLISLLLLRKFKSGLLAGFAKLWAYASVPSIIFGVIFDEWMGFSHSHLIELLGVGHLAEGMGVQLPLYHGISRVENVPTLIALALITGVIQLLLGFALGTINDWDHHRKHSYAKMGWIGILLGGFFAISIMLFSSFPNEWLYPAGGLLGIGVLVVLIFEGPMGLFEIPGLTGNVLSYARIAGVGLAGVIPAEFIINKLLLPKPEAGIVMALVMVPVYLAVHLANILLGMVESLAQGARLNMVEFYSKFYKGGGRKFAPFRVERVHTRGE